MCGIVGVRHFDRRPVAPDLLAAMTDSLIHRGPDDRGTWIGAGAAQGCALGHRRLSIIDLAGSPQPMGSADGRFWIAFNGEIFNYRELRATLDYPFRTHGDTEVLLAGLIRLGLPFLDRVRGQFAFALVDASDGSLVLGRDRVGVLPLYYHHDGRTLVLASEIKALLPALGPHVAVDTDSLDSYLAHNAVHAPFTLFKGIRKVLPGHVLKVDPSGALRAERYWDLPRAEGTAPIPAKVAVCALGDALRTSVGSAMVADVPVGAYLSGGLDSSLITALMRAHSPDATIETFSAGFGDARFDELPHARRVAQRLGTKHHEVHISDQDFARRMGELTWFRDAPLSQPADVAVHELARLARRSVKVVLSGEGSDELFAGYRKYAYAPLVEAASMAPWGISRSAARRLEPVLPMRLAPAAVVLRAAAAEDPVGRMDSWFAPFSREQRVALLGSPAPIGRADGEPRRGDVVPRMLEHDLRYWLPDNLLERGDRMSMAASLELRPPFLDREVVELAFRLPSSVKVRHGRRKWVVKQVARDYLPPDIVNRAKVGFRVPLDAWFRGGLGPLAHDLLLSPDSFAREVFDLRTVNTILERHERGPRNEEKALWTLLSLEVWHRAFFAGRHSGSRGSTPSGSGHEGPG